MNTAGLSAVSSRAWLALRALVARHTPDALMLAGAAAVTYGAWQIYAPAGPILGGGLVFAVGYLAARGR